MAQESGTIRVGIMPQVLGLEGADPIEVQVPRDTPQDQVRAVAIELARQKAGTPTGLGSEGGLEVGPLAEALTPAPESNDMWGDTLRSIPQIAGLLASFTPQGRTMRGAMAIPGMVSAGTQMLTEGEIDPGEALSEGLLGGAFRGLGKGVEAIGRKGEGAIRRALFGGSGKMPTNVQERELPRMAAREKARMIREQPATPTSPAGPRIPGSAEDMMRRSGEVGKRSTKIDQRHLPRGKRNPDLQRQSDTLEAEMELMQDLSRQISAADQAYRTRAGILPQILAGGGMTGVLGAATGMPAQATAAVSPIVGASTSVAPLRMAIGSALTRPFGISTEDTLAPVLERLARVLGISSTSGLLELLDGGGDDESVMRDVPEGTEPGSSPRRRRPQ